MGKRQINKVYLKGCEEILRKNGSKFVLMLALGPDGTVHYMKNIENVTEEEMLHTIKWFLIKYKKYKAGLADDILKDLGL